MDSSAQSIVQCHMVPTQTPHTLESRNLNSLKESWCIIHKVMPISMRRLINMTSIPLIFKPQKVNAKWCRDFPDHPILYHPYWRRGWTEFWREPVIDAARDSIHLGWKQLCYNSRQFVQLWIARWSNAGLYYLEIHTDRRQHAPK